MKEDKTELLTRRSLLFQFWLTILTVFLFSVRNYIYNIYAHFETKLSRTIVCDGVRLI